MAFALAIAAAASDPVLERGLAFDCNMVGPDNVRFDLHGTSDGKDFRTNIATWLGLPVGTEFKGGPTISVENMVHNYEWNGPKNRATLNVKMIEYSSQSVAVLSVVEHSSDGRHSWDKLIGTGLCKTRGGSTPSKDHQ